jgi:mannan endo-1,4-beta-mannosidase
MTSKFLRISACCLCLILYNISDAKLAPTQSNLGSESADILLEAEDAKLKKLDIFPRPDSSGKGYVKFLGAPDAQLEFNFDSEGGFYELIIGYATPIGQKKGYDLWVNDSKSMGLFPAGDGLFHEHNTGKYKLNDGQNTVIIGRGWGWFDIDYIKLNRTTVQPPLKPPVKLSDKQASSSAKALMSFLVDYYGTKTLSAQQGMKDIEYIVSVTGKSPAIGCFDLIDYSPSRIEFGAKPEGSVESWIKWAQEGGGIVSLCWHWNAPTELINNEEEGKAWWLGFYTRATTFNLDEALSNKHSENYRLLLRDMDAIAKELKKFQEADIPVLWRPLHEAAGGWFWWGAKGPEPFKKLWNLMYDRFTNHHGLHNLIWVYTTDLAGDMAWYPGDDSVDIVSLDIYTDPSSNMSGHWENTQKHFNGKKLVALSESGTIPDPDKIRTYATWWSWFCVWSGKFIHDIKEDTLKLVYNDEDVITLDELPDWRNYK